MEILYQFKIHTMRLLWDIPINVIPLNVQKEISITVIVNAFFYLRNCNTCQLLWSALKLRTTLSRLSPLYRTSRLGKKQQLLVRLSVSNWLMNCFIGHVLPYPVKKVNASFFDKRIKKNVNINTVDRFASLLHLRVSSWRHQR